MTLLPKTRFLAALIALFSMLFMQLAMASYACPNMGHASDHAMSATMTPMKASQTMTDCVGMDMEQPTLCHAHADDQQAHQSLDKPDLPQVPAFVASKLMQDVIFIDVPYHPLTLHLEAVLLSRITAPPLSIRNCCFRI